MDGLASAAPGLAAASLASYTAAALVGLAVYLVASYLNHPLRQYPGPFLAGFTNLWRLYYIARANFQHDLIRLHKRYGPVVRIGPNVLDVDDPALIKTVFNVKGEWKKTDYYRSAGALINGRIVHNLFSEDDNQKHAAEKKLIAKYYSPNGIATLEPLIDKTIAHLCDELDRRFTATGEAFDLGQWILYYAWDVVGTVSFSQPFGYLAAGRDVDGTLGASAALLDYFSWVGCVPQLDRVLDKNRVVQALRPGGFSALGATCAARLGARYRGTDAKQRIAGQADFLDRFLETKAAVPGVSDMQVVAWVMINMGAGADTTAITIRSALYYSLKTPGVWSRLRAELAAAGLVPTPDRRPVSFKQARAVPYLEAVVREALRYLPGVSLGLERYVPAGGQRLSAPPYAGAVVPEGAVLAFNPFVLCRNREAWGPDADEFRPERWLRADGEPDDAFAQRLRIMNDADLSFGAGSRMCIGKHLGVMQTYKVVATLALYYDTQLVDPEREWTVINSWFPRQEGLDVRMTRREAAVRL